MAENHIIKVKYSPHGSCRTRSVFQYDYGQVLQFENFNELPNVFEVHFSKPGVDETISMIGENNVVKVPDECLESNEAVAWLFLHDSETDGETRFVIWIPIKPRKAITNSEPTEQEHDIISEAIVVLNRTVEETNVAKDTTLEAEEHVVSLASEIRDIRDETTEARDSALAAADEAVRMAAEAEAHTDDASSSASEANVVLENVQEVAGQVTTELNNAQEYARQARASAETAAGSESNAALSQRLTHEDMIATQSIKNDVENLKTDVTDLKDDVSRMRSDVFQSASSTAENANSAAESAAAASASVGEMQEAVQNIIAETTASLEAAARSANSAQEAARNASSYALRSENASSSAESAATRASTNANNANRYASNARSYAASAERYASDAEFAKEEAERIAVEQSMAIAPVQAKQSANQAYSVGDYFIYNNRLYQATSAIAKDETILPGTNCSLTTITEELKDIQTMNIHICTVNEYDEQAGLPTIQNPDSKTFYLVPGGDSPNLYVEWVYTNNAWEQFGSATIDLSGYITDVKINNVSVVENGVANIQKASENNLGVVGIEPQSGVIIQSNGKLELNPASSADIKRGENTNKPIAPFKQEVATFYGLAKAAGDTTQSQSANAVGQYTDNAKTAIREMLDAASSDIIAVQDTQPTSSTNKVWLDELHKGSVQVPTVAEMNTALEGKVGDVQVNGVSVVNQSVANVPIANDLGRLGVFKIAQGSQASGLTIDGNGNLYIAMATSSSIKGGTNIRVPVVPSNQHESTFYGLAKAAGDSTQSQSNNAVGQYTDNAKAAIQNMLGVSSMIAPVESDTTADRAYAIGEIFSYNGKLYQATDAIAQDGAINPSINCQEVTLVGALPHDVHVNGVSVVTNGVANVPVCAYNRYGVVKSSPGEGIADNNNGVLYINWATSSIIKNPDGNRWRPITPAFQHESAFYGLAKAAGDTTQAQSNNTVGVYTNTAKEAIKTMLGVSNGTEVVRLI